jgi:hypothetical protein
LNMGNEEIRYRAAKPTRQPSPAIRIALRIKDSLVRTGALVRAVPGSGCKPRGRFPASSSSETLDLDSR